MRVTPGTTLDEVYRSLSKRQQNRIRVVEVARAREDAAVRAVINRSREAVRRALDAGVPARILADRLSVSSARVYQMREEAEKYATRSEDETDG